MGDLCQALRRDLEAVEVPLLYGGDLAGWILLRMQCMYVYI